MQSQNDTESKHPKLLTKEKLREALNLPSTRKIDYMMKKHMIPFYKWGPKTVRFDLAKVMAALEKFEYKAVGRK
jgi:hypothetical protein